MTSRPTPRAPGGRAAALARNDGVVQTGDHAQVRQVAGAVSLGSPHTVPPPPDGIVGLPKPARRVFVGRGDHLAELDRLVRAGAGVVAQAVHGLGGVGKSELALQYADRHRSRYRVVWWVAAETRETTESGLADLAFRVHPDVQVIATQAEAASWALSWLQSHDGWLLVLDNVEQRGQVEPLLGQLSRGHVLITTRRDLGWEDITDGCLRLEVLHPDAAVALLTRVSGQPDTGVAGVLAGELGCLPLALTQAAAYLRHTRTSMADYLRRLREDPAGVLALVTPGDDAQRAVARTWSVTVTDIERESPLAVRILRILSCLAPDDLPRDVLHPLADTGVDTALGLLASHSMITLTETTVAVHRLVQAVTVDQLRQPPSELDGTLRAAIGLLVEAMPDTSPDDMASWPRRAALSPHVAALADLCPDDVGGEDLASLLADAGWYDSAQGRYWQALAYRRRALAISEARFGADHPTVGVRLGSLAISLRLLGRPAEAEPLQRRALAVTEAALGPDHPDVGITLNNLALTLLHLRRAPEAELLQRRALAVTEATLGPDHPDLAVRMNNLALILRDLGRAEEAEPLHRRDLAISEATLGPDHLYVAITLENLAQTLTGLGRSGEAESLKRRARAIRDASA